MSGSDGAPRDEERIAPVIPLFGASSDSGPGRAHPAYGAAHREEERERAQRRDDVPPQGEARSEEAGLDAGAARDTAVRALGRRDLSQRELERSLRDAGYAEAIVSAVVRDMQDHGYQDDVAFAQILVGRLQERKGLGRTGISAELARRMFSPAAISYALELIDSGDELARAREVAAKRAGQLRGLDRETAARRLTGYLQRRGYSGSTVRSAVDAALPATGTVGRTVRFE